VSGGALGSDVVNQDEFLLIGHPVGHSVSPSIHAAAYQALGRSGRYRVIDCPTEEDVAAVVARIRSGEIRGANVTVPHKLLALRLADEVAPSAEEVGAANVLARGERGQIVAYNTDAPALAEELVLLTKPQSSDVAGARRALRGALVLGNGGASLAAVVSAKLAGFGPIWVTARRFSGAKPWPDSALFEALGAQLLAWPTGAADPAWEVLEACDVLVQATSAGMKGAASGHELAERIPLASFRQLGVYDLVYNPSVTPLLAQAQRAGLRARGGLGMLVGQAALAIEIWWGTAPPRDVMMAAARKALGLSPIGEAQ
jgi:shikimate dehydrogenase